MTRRREVLNQHNQLNTHSPDEFKGDVPNLVARHSSVFSSAGGKAGCILGIGCLSHDSSVALVNASTGDVLYAIAEERLSNLKHDSRLPWGGILTAIKTAEQQGMSIKSVSINFDPSLFLPGIVQDDVDELSSAAVENKTYFFGQLSELAKLGVPLDLEADQDADSTVSKISDLISQQLGLTGKKQTRLLKRLTWYFNMATKYYRLKEILHQIFAGIDVCFYSHHDCHAATARYGSGKTDGLSIVIDGHGETDTTTLYKFNGNEISRISETKWPVSIGSLYLAITRYLGFDHGDEYKVMGMTAYGKPVMKEHFHDAFKVTEYGNVLFTETDYFYINEVNASGQLRFSTKPMFARVCLSRLKDEEILQAHFDLAASLQSFVEEISAEIASRALQCTGSSNISLAGGVALNGLMNNAIRKHCRPEDIFIYPASSDDGTSVGAALMYLQDKGVKVGNRLRSCYFGSAATSSEIQAALEQMGINYERPDNINATMAQALNDGKIVARFSGRSEFGPRALGHRSILANPTIASMKDTINVRIKHREPFRPFAPAVIKEFAPEYFDLKPGEDAPFMILIVSANEKAKSTLPAVVHADGTARVQTVTIDDNPDFHKTLSEFQRISGVPVLINTSFNINGEAIVELPLDAIESFLFMDIDYLAIGDFWVAKEGNRNSISKMKHEEYLALRKRRYEEMLSGDYPSIDPRKYSRWFFPKSRI